MSEASVHLAWVRDYLAALEAGATGEALARFFAPDAVQIELPNRLNPNRGRSDLADILRRAELGKTLLKQQRYVERSALADGNRVAMEAEWVGVLAIDLGTLKAGSEMKASFAMFFEFTDGRIALQRNYDCFEAW